MQVTSRGFRAWRIRPMSQRQRDDMVLLAHIREQHRLSLQSYGRPQMTEEQAWRNALQSKLSNDVSVAGVTLSRFIIAGPIAGVYLYGLYQYQDTAMPTFNNAFWGFIVGASVMQILATGLMVKLFKMNNYAVGAGLAKSEALVAAILGVLFLARHFLCSVGLVCFLALSPYCYLAA